MRSVGIGMAVVCCAGLAAAAPKRAAKKPQTSKRTATQSKKAASDASRFTAPKDATSTAAYRYGQLSQTDCEAELTARKVPFVREGTTRGIRAPVRLTGPLHGVEFRTNLPDKQRATTPWEIGDCRLILALDDFSQILARHDITSVRHYSMYRLPPKDWPDGKDATRHNGGVAIDAARFIKKDGSYLDVDKHYNGAIGDVTCGDKAAPHPVTAEATELRAILCEAVDQRLFHVVLTPNYNKPHHNHFHLEITAGVGWFLVH
jgi:hypothetical protein